MSEMPTRRALLGAGIALAGTAGLASRAVASPAVASPAPASPSRAPSPARAADQYVTPDGPEVVDAENRRGAGPLRKVSLTAAASRLDLGGGLTVPTWAYGDRLPGEAIRITAGDTLELALANHLTQSTTMHWHGLSIRNDMDGVPALTQQPVKAGADFTYRFAVTHPGTHWIHPHSGVQLDRGLYAPLIVEDPEEPLAYDKEWVVVLDDWLDGVDGSTPTRSSTSSPRAGAPPTTPPVTTRRARAEPRAPPVCWRGPGAICSAVTPAMSPTPTTWSTGAGARTPRSSRPGRATASGCASSTPAGTPRSGWRSAATG